MKKVLFLTSLLLITSLGTLQAQNKDRVIHIKKYDFGKSSTYGLFLTSEEGEEEIGVTKQMNGGEDETFIMEFVSGEEYQFQCHFKNFNDEYLTVRDGKLVVSGKTKPARTFMVLWEGENDKKDKYYRMWFDEKVGIDITANEEVKADGSSAGFFLFKEVEDGLAMVMSGREDTRNYRLSVYTSKGSAQKGFFTETTSDIELIVYYKNKNNRSYTQKINCGKMGAVAGRSKTESFSVDGYVYQVELVNKGQGINQTWRVDWIKLYMEVGTAYQLNREWNVNDWINPDMSRFFN